VEHRAITAGAAAPSEGASAASDGSDTSLPAAAPDATGSADSPVDGAATSPALGKTGAASGQASPGAVASGAPTGGMAAGELSARKSPSAKGEAPASSGNAGQDAGAKGGAAVPAGPPDAVRISGPNSQGVTDSEIAVGVLAPLSGLVGFVGQLEVDAIRAYLADINAKGGVNGRKFRIIAADNRLEPSTEAVAARRLVEQDRVFALVAPFADAIASYVTAKGVPTVTMGVLPPAYSSKYPNVYPVGFNALSSTAVLATKLVRELKIPIKTAAIMYDTANLPWGAWVEYAQRAWEAVGVKVVSVDRFNVSDGDCTSLVLKMKNLNVDFWNHANSAGWPLCEQAMSRQKWLPKYGRGGFGTDDINFVGQIGKAADGIYAVTNTPQITKNKGTPYPWDPSGVAPAVDDYIRTMREYSPRSANDAGLEGIWAQSFWVAAKLIHQAVLRQTEALTWKGMNQWISSQKAWASGLVAPTNFDPKCKTGSTPEWVFQFKWDDARQRLYEADWHPYGPPSPVPTDVSNAMIPGAGACMLTAMADAKL
jgi:ABC-type branched-subunit amino acid transport system substrate-binding protein